ASACACSPMTITTFLPTTRCRWRAARPSSAIPRFVPPSIRSAAESPRKKCAASTTASTGRRLRRRRRRGRFCARRAEVERLLATKMLRGDEVVSAERRPPDVVRDVAIAGQYQCGPTDDGSYGGIGELHGHVHEVAPDERGCQADSTQAAGAPGLDL